MKSRFGGYFDSILDRYADGFIVLGIALGLYRTQPHWWILLVSALALIGAPMSMMIKDRFKINFRRDYNSDEMDGPAKFLLANWDGRIFIISLGGIFNQLLFVLIILVITTNLLALYRLIRVWYFEKSEP